MPVGQQGWTWLAAMFAGALACRPALVTCSNASNRRGAPPLAGNSARKKLLVAPLRSNSNTTEPTDMISEAEKFVLGMSSDAAAAAAESAPLPPPMQLEDQLATLRSQVCFAGFARTVAAFVSLLFPCHCTPSTPAGHRPEPAH